MQKNIHSNFPVHGNMEMLPIWREETIKKQQNLILASSQFTRNSVKKNHPISNGFDFKTAHSSNN